MIAQPTVHLYRSDTAQWVGQIALDQGFPTTSYVEWEGQTWAVLERRHQYFLRGGTYQLNRVALFVRPMDPPKDRVQFQNNWVIGDPTCRYNAHSELLRCVPNPEGPCEGCRFFELA